MGVFVAHVEDQESASRSTGGQWGRVMSMSTGIGIKEIITMNKSVLSIGADLHLDQL